MTEKWFDILFKKEWKLSERFINKEVASETYGNIGCNIITAEIHQPKAQSAHL